MKKLSIEEAFNLGIRAHRDGQFKDADNFYTAILKSHPLHPDANHNMGVLALGFGKTPQALTFFDKALQADPKRSQFWLSLIETLIKLGRKKTAKDLLNKATLNGLESNSFNLLKKNMASTIITNDFENYALNPPQFVLQPIINLYSNGEFESALASAQILRNDFPKSSTLLNLCGAANSALNQFEEAIKNYEVAVEVKPDYADAYYNMANAFRELNNIDSAILNYKRAIEHQYNYSKAHYNLGNAYQDHMQFENAANSYRAAIRLQPIYPEALNNLGVILQKLRQNDEAVECFRKAIQHKPDYSDAYYNLGISNVHNEDYTKAINCFETSLSYNPGSATTHNGIANLFKELNDIDRAVFHYNKAIELNEYCYEAYFGLSLIGNKAIDPNIFKKMTHLAKTTKKPNSLLYYLDFALAREYERKGDFEKSYLFYANGNCLRRNELKYDISLDQEKFHILKQRLPTCKSFTISTKINNRASTPIFILGMPRSGTTLFEQIIASHSSVYGAGELYLAADLAEEILLQPSLPSKSSVTKFRDNYLNGISLKSNGTPFVTDKMPQNFLYIPLILAAIPEAKIVHVTRDPRATCWSNFKQCYAANGLGFSYNIIEVAKYYKMYSDLMAYWNKLYPSRISNFDYEKLTQRKDLEIKNLLDTLDLSWEENCFFPERNPRVVKTASQFQVKKKIYQNSSHAWEKFSSLVPNDFSKILTN